MANKFNLRQLLGGMEIKLEDGCVFRVGTVRHQDMYWLTQVSGAPRDAPQHYERALVQFTDPSSYEQKVMVVPPAEPIPPTTPKPGYVEVVWFYCSKHPLGSPREWSKHKYLEHDTHHVGQHAAIGLPIGAGYKALTQQGVNRVRAHLSSLRAGHITGDGPWTEALANLILDRIHAADLKCRCGAPLARVFGQSMHVAPQLNYTPSASVAGDQVATRRELEDVYTCAELYAHEAARITAADAADADLPEDPFGTDAPVDTPVPIDKPDAPPSIVAVSVGDGVAVFETKDTAPPRVDAPLTSAQMRDWIEKTAALAPGTTGLTIDTIAPEPQETPPMPKTETASSTPTSIVKTLQADATDAAWRTAGSQFVKLARDPLVALLTRHLDPKEEDPSMRARVAEFLKSDLGVAMLAALLSAGLVAMPAVAGDVPARLARELRVRAMADTGDVVADVLMGPLRQVMSLYLQGVPTISVAPAGLEDGQTVDTQAARVGERAGVAR